MPNQKDRFLLKNKKECVISKASVDDAAQLVSFLNKVGGETDNLTFGLNEFHLSICEERAFISKCLESNQYVMLVGKIRGMIVSQLFLDRSNNPRLAHIGDVAISVEKKYWGNSIGAHMMNSVIDWAKLNGITKLQLHVRTDNDAAIHLYKTLGFYKEGVIKRAIRINDIYFDNYIMGLIL